MPDNLKRKRPEDPKQINRNQEWELNWWSQHFGVSKADIIKAIDAVGPMASSVEAWLISKGLKR